MSYEELSEKFENATAEERMQAIQEQFPQFKITTTFIEKVKSEYGYANKYKVTIRNGKKHFSTTFTDSINNTQKGIKSDDIDIIYCIVADAQCVQWNNSFEDFCSEFGYDTDSRSAERIYNACEKTYNNIQRLFNSDGFDFLSAVTYGY